MKRFSMRAAMLTALVILPASAYAQAVYGNISGTITDASGSAVPQADVTVVDLDRGISTRTTTNAEGNFSQTHLLAGRYEIRVNAKGFAPFVASAIVQVDTTTRIDGQLQVGSEQSTVTVTAETPLFMADRAEVSTTLTGGEVQELPVLNRNLTQLMLIVPGSQLNSWQHAASENPQGGLQINANGQFFTANGFVLDGTENQSSILGIAVINPNLDSLQDFKVSTSNYDAEFGAASGALVHATTRSGTNQFHGSLFEFLRNDIFNAKNHFTGLNPPLRWNQFGGSVGGPILKDRLFGFFDYQGTRRRTGGSLITTVPTAAERAGDLSGMLGDYICNDSANPASGSPCANPVLVTTTEGATVPARAGMAFDPTSGDPATGSGRRVYSTNGQVNVIPVAPAIANLLTNLPEPNLGTDIFNNYVASASEKFDSDQIDARVDYQLSATTHSFGRYTLADFTRHSPGAYGELAGGPSPFGFAGQALARNQSLAAGIDHAFSPTLIADFRFGFYRYRVRVQPNGVGTTPATDAGLPGLNTGSPETSGMPAFYIHGDGEFNFGYALNVNQCNCPLKETENQFQWVSNWTKQAGNHSVKWGADVRRGQTQRVPSDSHRSGEITFDPGATGNPDVDAQAAGLVSTGSGLASFLIGEPSSFARYFTGNAYYPGLRETRLFLFVQDSWRITPKLTVNYGLRWENYLPQTVAKPGGAGTFDPTTGDILVPGIGGVPRDMGVKAYNLGFAPRVGIAYQVTEKTVVRTGYGRSFNPSGLGAIFGQGADYNPPITFPQSVNGPNPYVAAFNLLAGPPGVPNPTVGSNGRFPLPDGISVYYFFYPPDSYRIPLSDFWNFTIQREIGAAFTAEVAYVGNVGRHIFVNPNVNQAVPGPGDYNPRRPFFQKFGLEQGLYQTCNCDNSNYNALQTKLQKRTSHGLDFLLTYTWSKAMSNSESAGTQSNNYDFRADHGPVSWDRTHVVTLTHNWDLPFGRGRHWLQQGGVVDAILGGWRLSGVHRFMSGAPFTPLVSFGPLLNTDFNNVRADIIGDPSVEHQSDAQWYNPAAFTAPQQPFRNGTASRNSLRGPALYDVNLALGKSFEFGEGRSLEFRWETFNTFNHVNLGQPENYVDVEGAGQITSTAIDMRQMQFGLHFRF